MSKSTHQIQVKAADQTGGAFQSIKNRAAATATSIRSVVGGALAAAGAYLSVRAVAGAVNELGHLSDVAQKTSTSVSDITKATTGLQVLGIDTDMERLAKAFQMMEKNTGRSGMQGFYETVGELGKIPDAGDRAAAAMKVFGRSGIELMPIINAADESTAALQGVINAMPGISQAAADAGDAAADAMKIAGDGIKRLWLEVIGKICLLFDTDLRTAAAKGVAYLTYFAKTAWRYLSALFQNTQNGMTRLEIISRAVDDDILNALGRAWARLYGMVANSLNLVKAAFESIAGPFLDILTFDFENIGHDFVTPLKGWWADVEETARNEYEALGWGGELGEATGMAFADAFADVLTDDLMKQLRDALAAAEELGNNYIKGARPTSNPDHANNIDIKRTPQVRNTLIMGGSAAALKLAVNGPQYRDEVKKQTTILERIAKNTEKTAENTKESGENYAATDL